MVSFDEALSAVVCDARFGLDPLRIFDLAVVLYQLLWLVRQFLAQMLCVFARDKIHVVQ